MNLLKFGGIKTKIKIPSLQHNKPDLVIWYKIDKRVLL